MLKAAGVISSRDVFYLAAEKLIRNGDAFVCDLTAEQVREYRGNLTEPGRNSPFRDRTVDENLDLFRRMRRTAILINVTRVTAMKKAKR